MALPVTISGVQMADQNYNHKPVIDANGNVYVILLDSTNQDLEAHKATDPTDSFTEQDNAGNPTDDHDYSVAVRQDGDTLDIVSYNLTNAAYEYHKFYTSDHSTTPDEWDGTVVNETIEAPSDPSPAIELSIDIVPRSDGTVVVIYNGDEDNVHGNPFARVDYNIRDTMGSWGGPVALDAGGQEDYHGSVAVLGESDLTHFFFKEDGGGSIEHRSLTSGDSLSSVEALVGASTTHSVGPGVYVDDGGTERIAVPIYNVSQAVTLGRVVDDGIPSVVADISDNDVDVINGTATHCLAVDGTTVHLLYAGGGGAGGPDQDLYHDQADTPQDSGDWGTDTEFKDAATINRISCNVIDRSGKKLAMVYDDGGTIMYDEKDIGVAGLAAQIANETADATPTAMAIVEATALFDRTWPMEQSDN